MKIGAIASSGALLLAAVVPAFGSNSHSSNGLDLGLNGQVVYTESVNTVFANTGGNVQEVQAGKDGGYSPESSKSKWGGHSDKSSSSENHATANMTTGDATAKLDVSQTIDVEQSASEGKDKEKKSRYGGSSHSSKDIDLNVQAVITKDSNLVQANTGENAQFVSATSEDKGGSNSHSYGKKDYGKKGGNTNTAEANMTTGNAEASVKVAKTIKASNVTKVNL